MSPLWIALRLPCLPLEALSPPANKPCVVFERRGNRRHVVCGNQAAVAAGVSSGMALGAATALAPSLEALERKPVAERAALANLAAAAYQFSGQITVQPTAPAFEVHTLWMEIGSSLRLFGCLETLTEKLRASLARLGYSYKLGVASTLEGASLAAAGDLVPVRERAQVLPAIQNLPLRLLPIPQETIDALIGSGMRTVRDVFAVPFSELAMRFDQKLTDYLGRLSGRLPDARRFYRLPERYRRHFEFEAELESMEALLFPMRRMLVELQEYLIARDTGVQEFSFELEHVAGKPTVLTVGMTSASRDAAHLQVLLRERLERAPMPGPVIALTLRADRFASPRVQQRGLFVTKTSTDEEWEIVLDRLTARLGAEAVHSLGLADDYRPEKSWCRLPPGQGSDHVPQKQRPLWLLPVPRPLTGLPNCVTGPERMEGGWWDGLDAARDYYQAQATDGARLWVYRDRRSGGWFLQGLWS